MAWELLDVAVDPMTIVYDRGKNVATNLMGEDGSIGLRVTSEFYSRELCRRLRKPVVSSSANVSGDPSPMCFAEISKEILDAAEASTVIRLGAGGLIKILRS